MINYLLKSGILLLVFYAVYKLWLENEKMFHFNRGYLLGSLIFSFIIPLQLFSLESFFPAKLPMIQLEGVVITTGKSISSTLNYSDIFSFALKFIYMFIVIIQTIRFCANLYSFYKTASNSKTQIINGQKVILVEESILPHSFWNRIFISKEDFDNSKVPSELIAHEKAHLTQKHTLDILFIEVLQILFWFNPLFILYKKAIKLNHEFLADEAVNDQFNKVSDYQKLLLDIASNKTNVALASNINYSITKKRFLMMNKEKSTFKILFKVFTVGVICSVLLLLFSIETNAQTDRGKMKMPNGFEMSYDSASVKKPEYPGGINEFYKLVGMNFKIPAEADKNKINGKMLIEFMVEKDGSLSEFKILKNLGYKMGEEAIRVIRLSPKWIPASDKGKPVRMLYHMPITIQADI